MLRTKIVCTIGPASRELDTLVQLIRAGMNVARLNMSHGDREFHDANVERVREAASRVGRPVAVLVDLQGPKLRVGQMGDGVLLQTGNQVILTTEDVVASPEKVPVQFKRLPMAVRPGDSILLDDGLLELVVRDKTDVNVTCQVLTGGMLTSNKGMNLPKADLSIASITEKDQEDLRFALEKEADWIALSFVRRAKEVYDLKDMIRRYGPADRATPVVAKIEKPEAVENIDSIIAAADGIMVARGDLGIETSPEAVPMVQKSIIRKCNLAGVPVITATQMLDSMIRNPRPTRAEASDVANAILDGTDAIMLSGETAVGKYPVRTVQTMVRIAALVEEENESRRSLPVTSSDCSISEAVCHAATDTVHMLGASAVIAPTVSGSTARTLSQFRPPCPIIAITPSPVVQHQLVLFWGIQALLSRRAPDTDSVIEDAVNAALQAQLIKQGDTVVVTAGTGGAIPGMTDLIKVYTLARTLARGTGVGAVRTVVGRVRRLDAPVDKDMHVAHDDIVVAPRTDEDFDTLLRDAAGLITLEGQEGSHARRVAGELDLPAIVGVDSIDLLGDGQWIVLDPERGLVIERLGMRARERDLPKG
jgi:pyruvate kinase